MKHFIFCIGIRMARWACVLGITDDYLGKAEELEKKYHRLGLWQ